MDAESLDKYEGLANAERDVQRQIKRQSTFRERKNNLGSDEAQRVGNNYLRSAQKGREGLEGQKPSQPELSSADNFTLMVVAGGFDLASFLANAIFPTVGSVVSSFMIMPIGYLVLYLMYKRRGIDFQMSKLTGKILGGAFIELIPFINALPGFMLSIYLIRKRLEKQKGDQKSILGV